MAIRKTDPEPIGAANAVQVDSDATTNELAIRDIDAWAAENGFLRTNEYWLRVVIRDGRRHFRGVCYRMTDDERLAMESYLHEVQDRASRLAQPRSA